MNTKAVRKYHDSHHFERSDEKAQRLSVRALEAGYESVAEYLLALADQDISDTEDDDDDEIDAATLHAEFKQAFEEVLQGKFLTEEEYKRMLAAADSGTHPESEVTDVTASDI